MNHSFLIIHGLGGSGPDHWQTWLYHELTNRNLNVCYPTFSSFDTPDKEVWLKELSDCLSSIPQHHTLTVITHSLGCLLWLHYLETQTNKIAEQAILVAPPSPTITLKAAKSFYLPPLNSDMLLKGAKETLFIHSTNDPYCSMKDAAIYTKLGAKNITFANMGHINTDSGHGKWPWILDFCLNRALISA
jgi:predicted alpha/beta hydrolase family esterase